MSCDFYKLPHEGIQSLTPYAAGKSIEALQQELGRQQIIKLASNENPLGCSPLAHQALMNLSQHTLATYPSASHHPLQQKLATQLAIDTCQLLLSNGSDALFTLIMTAFALHRKRHILITEYAFSAYAIQAQTLGIPVISTPLEDDYSPNINALLETCCEDTGIIFLANPNNPIGTPLSTDAIVTLLSHIPKTTLLVIDEAYYEYQPKTQQPLSGQLDKFPNLIITRTFSKAYGLAGLRLGYAIANPDVIAILKRIQLPFCISQTALTAGAAALDDTEFLTKSIALNTEGRGMIQQTLTQLGFKQLPTSGNFVTFDCAMDGAILYKKLQQYGIIVRPLHPYGLPNHLRVTIGTAAQNQQFLETLAILTESLV